MSSWSDDTVEYLTAPVPGIYWVEKEDGKMAFNPSGKLPDQPSDDEGLLLLEEPNDHVVEILGTGARQSQVEERYDCLPVLGLYRAAQTAGLGARKYGEDNWQKGIPIRSHLNHALRHIYLYLSGDTSEDHLGHAAWRMLAASHMDEMAHSDPRVA